MLAPASAGAGWGSPDPVRTHNREGESAWPIPRHRPRGSAPRPQLALEQADVNVRDLIEAGVHFGHQTRRWDPRMKPFLFGERNGVHILDLDQTLPRFRAALDFVRETAGRGGKLLFVGTKRQAQAPVQLEAARSGQYYVNNRWLGGMLTNFKTVKKSIERFKELLATIGDETKTKELSKKDLAAHDPRASRSIASRSMASARWRGCRTRSS